jgi:putative copper export protein
VPATSWLYAALLATHLLSVAAWFGALIYRTFVVNVRAGVYFDKRERDYEEFMLVLTDGARRVVLAALVVGGLSGVGLLALRWQRLADPAWAAMLLTKSALYASLFAGFVYISWWLWPRRAFALPAEFPAERRHSQLVALVMLVLLTAAMLLGVASSQAVLLP